MYKSNDPPELSFLLPVEFNLFFCNKWHFSANDDFFINIYNEVMVSDIGYIYILNWFHIYMFLLFARFVLNICFVNITWNIFTPANRKGHNAFLTNLD